jgi:hypothetical protein
MDPADLILSLCLMQGNEEFELTQISQEEMDRLDGTRVGTPAVFVFRHDGKIRVWPTPSPGRDSFWVRLKSG